MSIIRSTIEEINENRFNKHNCIPFYDILPRLSEAIPGIQKRYYIVSGASSAGKSQFTDHVFVFNPFDFTNTNTDIDFDCDYYSFELDKKSKMHQWINKRLFERYGLRIDINILQSAGKNRLSDDLYAAVLETEEYFERMEDKVRIIDSPLTPAEIIRNTESYAAKNGKVILKEDGDFDKWIPNNPKKYHIIIVDHYSLLNTEKGMSIKLTIEQLSRYFVNIRNKYGFVPVGVQQQTAESENLEHFKSAKLEPSKTGLAETKLTYNDCDVAFGVFSPQKHEIKNYRGYDILTMRDAYRSFNVFKNRYGQSDLKLGLYFDGAVGFFKELPKAEGMTSDIYESIKKRRPNW